MTRNRTEEEGPLRAFVDELRDVEPPVYRSPGTAVFLNADTETTPLAMRANVEHNHALHRERRDPLDRDAQRPERARSPSR